MMDQALPAGAPRPGLRGLLSAADLQPKFLRMLRQGYGWTDLRADYLAGLTVAIVALPLSMALAIASGATPAQGLITAVVAGFVISALGGSRFQIGGPTGAFAVIVYGVIAHHGYDGLVLATLMAGAMIVVGALAGLGAWIRYIPDPVVTGFTSGIAVTIASGQIADFLGLKAHSAGAFLGRVEALWAARSSLSLPTLALGLGCIAVLVLLKRFAPRLPAFLIVVVGGALAVALLHLPAMTIGARFGALPAGLPMPRLPPFSLAKAQAVFPSALTIAFLAAVESLLSCMVADGMTGARHRPNAELMGQGLANIASSLFGGLPATGAIARTATNVRAGAHTPAAGMIAALTVLGFMLVAAPLAAYAPLAALAAILFIVSWNMAEVHRFGALLKGPMGDRVVLVVTFGLTVFADLTIAIAVGVVLAALRFMHRMAQSVSVEQDDSEDQRQGLPPGVEAFRFSGPLFFGAASRLDEFFAITGPAPQAIILRLEAVPLIDATAARLLASFIGSHRDRGVQVILCGLRDGPRLALARSGLSDVETATAFEAAKAMVRSSDGARTRLRLAEARAPL